MVKRKRVKRVKTRGDLTEVERIRKPCRIMEGKEKETFWKQMMAKRVTVTESY